MTLLATIKAAQLQARKNKDTIASSLLTTLIGDASMVGKNNGNRESTDAEVVAVIKKFISNINETIKLLIDRGADLGSLAQELSILETFLPKQLTESELTEAVRVGIMITQAASIKDMGKVMKHLKEHHEGQFDGSVASALIKQQLAAQV